MIGVPTRRSRPVLTAVGLLVAYYAFPVSWGESTLTTVLSVLLTVAGLALVTLVLTLELHHQRIGIAGRSTRVLAMLLVLLVMSASLTFFLLDQLAPDEIIGLDTRTDALYFTLVTMSTVGYGDVHADGQIARALVCALIVFNVVVVASLVRAHTRVGQPPS